MGSILKPLVTVELQLPGDLLFCLALQWLDIDLVNKTITVNKSVDVQSNTAINKKGGKSKSAVRLVPISDVLVAYLKQYKLDNGINNPFDLVCTNTKGGQL